MVKFKKQRQGRWMFEVKSLGRLLEKKVGNEKEELGRLRGREGIIRGERTEKRGREKGEKGVATLARLGKAWRAKSETK